MTAAVLFAFYAGTAGTLGPVLLRGRWAARSPQLAMTLWLVLPVSFLAAVVLAVLAATAPFALSWPAASPGGGPMLLAGPAVPGGPAIALAGLLLAAAVVVRAASCVAGELHRGRSSRREHATLVAAGLPGHEPGVAIVDHDAPAIYCLPGRQHQIVITAGALAVLTPGQLRAVLAHERAHLRRRHHLILGMSAGVARAFPRVPLLGQARPQLAMLAEMSADDAAVRRHRRDDLAAALVVLARAGAQPATLAASGPEALARLERILDPEPPRTGLARMAAVAGLIPPVVIACLPLLLVACDASGYA